MSAVLSPLEERIAELTILDVGLPLLGNRLVKRPVSGKYQGLCPIHAERTPSFFLVPKWNSFVCYGCGNRGGPVTLAYHIAVHSDRAGTFKGWTEIILNKDWRSPQGVGKEALPGYIATLSRIDPLDRWLPDAIDARIGQEADGRHVRDVRVPSYHPLLPFEEIA